MSKYEIKMPKMGESVQDAKITKIFVNIGQEIIEDDILFEIATDKVDSEIPSAYEGIVEKILFEEGDIVNVGETIAIINSEKDSDISKSNSSISDNLQEENDQIKNNIQYTNPKPQNLESNYSGFLSPLVKKIIKEENISESELENIIPTGKNNRIQKDDILNYIRTRGSQKEIIVTDKKTVSEKIKKTTIDSPPIKTNTGDQILEMDRVRKIIADRMLDSKSTMAHVTAVVEADLTNLVNWRNKHKNSFLAKNRTKLTYMPMVVQACTKALHDYPELNSWVDNYKIIRKPDINIGIAVALEDNNLIVPVVKNTNHKSISGLAVEINELADKARNSKLDIADLENGSFTISNFGSFGNLIGTPIINKPQVAILAIGTIEKKPAVIETEHGDAIAIRHKMYLSLSYDHRVIDGALGGKFLSKIKEYLENFNTNQTPA
ncbi:MAG: 2-oxo acid dehydrogenase subunit E2 [Marinifilaceae bacterium]|jgi:2-oxoglutarate dehydrogenase E2 component (dihydrolipoamide succinyltransferase)|nr:2-oxo acid dehydrogenase subunit E2 [Marinifilaceae bacterium]